MNRIIVDPKVMIGKPVIKGTRLTVQCILGLLAQGMTTEEIIQEYSKLTKEDIIACLLICAKCIRRNHMCAFISLGRP